MRTDGSDRLVFDIETIAMSGVDDYLRLDDIRAPANYRDPEKVADYIEKTGQKQREKAATDPDLCEIVCISFWPDNSGGSPTTLIVDEHFTERDVLRCAFGEMKHRMLVGFNCVSFDIPVLLRRALYLNIAAPDISCDKYRHPHVVDLQLLLSHNGTLPWHSLNFYCRRFGIDIPDPLDGKGVGQAWAEGRFADVGLHCEADVYRQAFLAEKVGEFHVPSMVF